jgi:glutamate-1-semialdehyde 2,1-aminomutase
LRIDLHTHSSASDGTDDPFDLVRIAADAGLEVVALTDHDTTAGWADAAKGRPDGLRLVRGAELSCVSEDGRGGWVSVHLLAYLFDPADPALSAEFARVRQARERRAERMVDLLRADGVDVTWDEVRGYAGGGTVGRPHLAQALIRLGLAGTVAEAFAPELLGERYRIPKRDTDVFTALRLVRAATGREPFVRFAGGYHGHADPFLSEAGSGLRTLGLRAAGEGRVVPYNDLDAVERELEGAACVFVEPVAGNMGVVPPAPGFLEGLRRLCDESGALLVFDEVITGFRVARGGAQERYGVLPDLAVLGKIVGGGLPLAAFGGRAELMERLAPDGDVYQAGTLSGNPLATAAGLSVLRRLTPDVYDELERKGRRLDAGLSLFGRFERVGAMATLFVDDYPALFRHLLERGIYLAPSQNEAMFLSTAHGHDEIDRTIEAVAEFFE